MRRNYAVLLSSLALMAGACGDPKCPPGYLQEGDTCYRCRVVASSTGKACVVGDAAVLVGEDDAGSDAADNDATADRDAGDEANAAMDAGNTGRGEPTDGAVSPSADSASTDDGSQAGPFGDAMTASGCGSTPCQHGGVCAEDGDAYSCDCSGTGYQGTRCDMNVDECAGANVCSGSSAEGVAFSFPCVNEEPYYRCEGQFPDWPLQDPPNRFSQGFLVIDDAKTHLQWEHPVSTQSYMWEGASAYCKGKGGGWRMPTRTELESIIDDTRSNPSIEPIFADTPSVTFWSSSLLAGVPAGSNPAAQFGWVISFVDGSMFPVEYLGGANVRCVRHRE